MALMVHDSDPHAAKRCFVPRYTLKVRAQTAFFEKVGVSLGPGPSASAVYGRGTYPVVC